MATDLTTWAASYYTATVGNATPSGGGGGGGGRGGDDDTCERFIDPQHGVFQIGCFLFCIGFLVPANAGFYQVQWLRLMLCCGFFFHIFWAGPINCWPDALGWTLVFFIINLAQYVYMVYDNRSIKFEDDLQEVFETFFKPFNIAPQQFKRLVDSHGEVYELDKTGHYAVEGKTLVDERLGLLLSGRMKVTAEGVVLHHVHKNQFLDSPEFESCTPGAGDHFQVTITAVEKCRYIQWSRKQLTDYLRREPFLEAVFEAIIGKDIMTKLYSLNTEPQRDSVQEITEEPATETTDIEGADDRKSDSQLPQAKSDGDVESLKEPSHGGSTHSLKSSLSMVDIRANIASGRGAAGPQLASQLDNAADADTLPLSEKTKLGKISE